MVIDRPCPRWVKEVKNVQCKVTEAERCEGEMHRETAVERLCERLDWQHECMTYGRTHF